jgi:hypothetical protein
MASEMIAPVLKSFTKAAPIETPSMKLWMLSPMMTIHATVLIASGLLSSNVPATAMRFRLNVLWWMERRQRLYLTIRKYSIS